MEVIIKGVEGVDVPITKEGEEYEKLQKAMEKQIRKRLQLRSTDEVTFHIKANPKVCSKCYGQIIEGKCRGKCNPYTPKFTKVVA